MNLRPYQEQALKDIRATVSQGVLRLVCQAATGAGKTLLAAAIVEGALRKGNRVVFVVPAISLVDQTCEMFWKEGITEVGVIQANHERTDWSKPVQVASIQTIDARETYPEAHVVIIDEVHKLFKRHIKWLQDPAWQKVPFIGLSATPWTRGLGKHFETLLVMATTADLIEKGYLSPFRVFASDHPDLSGVKVLATGDYHEGQLSAVMQDSTLVGNIIETWKAKWGKDKTLLFGVDCAHAQMLQQRFHDAGVSCAYQDAKTPSKERAEIKRGFHDGRYKVVANVGTLTTGVDWDVRCLVLARPTKSEMLFVQIIGRALRTAEGKPHALILDHTDTTSRLGFVTDIHHEHLSSGKMDENKAVKRSPPLPKPCPQCACLLAVGVKVCPECGFERKIESKVFERDGELVEFNGSFRKKGETNARERPYTMVEKARFYAQLKGYGTMKNYNPGWAANQYREKFGAWPDWSIKHVTAMTPGPEVTRWILHGLLVWAKSKRREEQQAKQQARMDL